MNEMFKEYYNEVNKCFLKIHEIGERFRYSNKINLSEDDKNFTFFLEDCLLMLLKEIRDRRDKGHYNILKEKTAKRY